MKLEEIICDKKTKSGIYSINELKLLLENAEIFYLDNELHALSDWGGRAETIQKKDI